MDTDNGSSRFESSSPVLQYAIRCGVFSSDAPRLYEMATRLSAAAEGSEDPNVRDGLRLLERICGYWLRAGDWLAPYGPAVVLGHKRSEIPTDISKAEEAVLHRIVADIPHALFRARVYDVLFLLSEPRDRIGFAIAHIQSVIDSEIDERSWSTEMDAWERAVMVARRLKTPTVLHLAELEEQLRQAIRRRQSGFTALRAAEMLHRHGMGRSHAASIARRLAQIASVDLDLDRSRGYREASSAWFKIAGDQAAADHQVILTLRALVDEGERLAQNKQYTDLGRASHLFELALQKARSLPRSSRAKAGISSLPNTLARRIRELAVAQLGSMRAFRTESIDLSESAVDAAKFVSGHEPSEALARFMSIASLASYESDKQSATQLVSEHSFSAMFAHVRYASDGRVIYRSAGQGGAPIYGVDPAVWRQMMQSFTLRIGLLVQGLIWPAYEMVSNEHHLRFEDFAALVSQAPIVPQDRERQYARALYQGYNGDFSTAMQLLAPQFENLIRVHLGNAGIATTTIEGGIENEVGIGNLMERADVHLIFGDDLTYEIRALLCGHLGLNVRNDVAHGLISDAASETANAVYFWWLALRLVYVPFWNSLHDTDAIEAREPVERDGSPFG